MSSDETTVIPGQLTLGDDLKHAGMSAAVDAVPDWASLARAEIERRAATGLPFTSEDVVAAVGLPRGEVETNRNNAVGAVMSSAARRKVIRRVGYQNARRADLHSAVIGIWVGATSWWAS